MMRNRKGFPLTGLAAVLVLLYTVYVLLDTFILGTVLQPEVQNWNTDLFASRETEAVQSTPETDAGAADAEAEADPETLVYQDENITVSLREYRICETRVYAAEVWLSSVQYLKTALAKGSYGKNLTEKTSAMVEETNAILAINGDYYGARESGYVIRNGTLYRDYGSEDTDVLCIYADGSFGITNSGEASAQALLDAGVWQAFSFGPALVENGAVSVSTTEEVGRAKASNPRTAIGILSPLHYLFVVSDGRTEESEGLTLRQLAEFMAELGAETAYNLDGGGSSTMVINGQVINKPTTGGNRIKERSVSDIVYVGS